jgi:hypothetical protein
VRALLLVLLLAGCAQLEDRGINYSIGVSNVWTFDVMQFNRKDDELSRPPSMIPDEEDLDV